MNKKVIVGTICVVLLTVLSIFILGSKNQCGDAIKFKREYESFNGDKVKVNGKNYKLSRISISKDNPISYINGNDIKSTLDNKTGVMFFGNSKDMMSRDVLPILLDVSSTYDCKNIYYYDFKKLKDKKNQKIYQDVNTYFNDKVIDYNFNIPCIIFFKDGKIKEYNIGAFDEYEIGKGINDLGVKELRRRFRSGFNSIDNGMCDRDTKC